MRRYPEREIEDTILKLFDKKFLDDEKTAYLYLDERKRAGDGPLKIKAGLFRRGLRPGIADLVMSGYSVPEIRQNIRKQIEKLAPRFSGTEKLVSALKNRGFPMDLVRNECGEIE